MEQPSKDQLFKHDGYQLVAEMSRYSMNNTLSVMLYTYGYSIDEPYAHVTVNLDTSFEEQLLVDPTFFNKIKGSVPVQFVDINNCKWLPEFLEEYGIAEPVFDENDNPVLGSSGWVDNYPLYKFNVDKCFMIYDPEEDEDEN